MFTGIIEAVGVVKKIETDKSNLIFDIASDISKYLKVDQSVSHNGACLTVVERDEHSHRVVAIQETLSKTNLKHWQIGTNINLERCLRIGDRLDGHMVQGHIDQIGTCIKKEEKDGSYLFEFQYTPSPNNILVEKGSICINGVSLTVVSSFKKTFSVAIIPYTYEHTSFQFFEVGSIVNLEFDIIGKYLAKMSEQNIGQ